MLPPAKPLPPWGWLPLLFKGTTMFKRTLSPRFAETDALGHLSNTTLPIWFEDAREPIFQIFNPELNLASWNLILARIEVDFVRQIYYGSEVVIRTYVIKVGNTSFTLLQEAWQKGELAARGTATMVYFDYASQHSAKIPEIYREQLEVHKLEGEKVIHSN